MKQYEVCKRISNSFDWSVIPKAEIDAYIDKPLLPVQAFAQLCWDETHLHVCLSATEPVILARFDDDLSSVCRDSCLEMFLSPMEYDGRYFNFEMNPNGASFIGFGHSREDHIRLHPRNVRELLNIKPHVEGNSWSVCYDIPEQVIQLFIPEFQLKSGHRMRANFYCCGDDIVPVHELMWNPITNGIPDFHQPKFFGEVILE